MMKKNYFLLLAVIGLVGVVIVAYAIMGRHAFLMLSIEDNQFQKYNGIVPILGGMLIPPAAGAWFDKKHPNAKWFPRIVIIPVLIYISGVLVGVGTNYLVNGMNSTFPMAYVTGPTIALTLYGIPCAVVIGILCYMLRVFLTKKPNATT